jgi:hypothetical protein
MDEHQAAMLIVIDMIRKLETRKRVHELLGLYEIVARAVTKLLKEKVGKEE